MANVLYDPQRDTVRTHAEDVFAILKASADIKPLPENDNGETFKQAA
jgi:hypothetical protein